jgi:drug/metabolite transporter (DMT)-like permease
MRTERVKITVGFIIISLIWGTTWLAIKVGLDSIPPLYAISMRFTLASIVLYLLLKIRKESMPLNSGSIFQYLNLAFLSFSIPFILVYWGQQFIASGMAAVIFSLYPFIVALASFILLSTDRLTRGTILGLVVSFVGIIIIFWNELNFAGQNTAGMLAVLASTILQGISLVLVKVTNHKTSPIALTLGGMILSVPIVLLMALFFEDYQMVHYTFGGVISVCYLGTIGSVVTFVIYYWLLERVETVYLSLVSFITPVIAVIVGCIFLGELLTTQFLIGSLFVLLGIIAANGKDLLNAVRAKKDQFPL